VNEILRRAMLDANLDEIDVAARLEVNPKTVYRWLRGRTPHSRHRWALVDLLSLSETELWPEIRVDSSQPSEISAIYPNCNKIPRTVWRNLFASAKREICILDNSNSLISENLEVIYIFKERAAVGVPVRILLRISANQDRREPSPLKACGTNDKAEGIGSVCSIYRHLQDTRGIEVRFYEGALYNSIYRADNEALCRQHIHDMLPSCGPVIHIQVRASDSLLESYLSSFERLWDNAFSYPEL